MRSIGHLLIHSLDIQRSAPVDNGHGGFDEVYSSAAVVIGRVNPVTAKDLAVLGKEESRVSHAIYFDAGVDVRIGDKIIFGARTFHVRVKRIEPSIPIYHKVMVEEIQEG
jgi:hypothetical protein